jgi:hypothetical protein
MEPAAEETAFGHLSQRNLANNLREITKAKRSRKSKTPSSIFVFRDPKSCSKLGYPINDSQILLLHSTGCHAQMWLIDLHPETIFLQKYLPALLCQVARIAPKRRAAISQTVAVDVVSLANLGPKLHLRYVFVRENLHHQN